MSNKIKIYRIEKIESEEEESVYDIEVTSPNHNFTLASGSTGIFVHNSLKIPKQYLGCLRGDTSILLLNGTRLPVEEMYNDRSNYIGKGVMACNPDGTLCPTTITNITLTKPEASFIRLHLDNGEYVDVTDDHRMMMRDGTFKFAGDVRVGDSLMPYYEKVQEGRRYVLNNSTGKYRPQYRVVAESVGGIPEGYQVHHKDHTKINDDFDNLEVLTVAEHYSKHSDSLPYIEDYEPRVNHKVTSIEYIDVGEPAYDISVAADCHTFALPCGIFVHNCTDDSTGFNGGSSLSLISARYAKTITRIQNTMIQTLTDAINLILVSKGFRGYVNKYVLHMVPPVTQNDLDRRDNITQKAQQTDTIMRLISDAGDDIMRLKALKSLLAGYLNDPDVIELLQEKIDDLEARAEKGENPEGEEGSFSGGEDFDFGGPSSPIEDMNLNFGGEEEEPESGLINEEGAGEAGVEEGSEEETLPTPEELGLDFTQNENFE